MDRLNNHRQEILAVLHLFQVDRTRSLGGTLKYVCKTYAERERVSGAKVAQVNRLRIKTVTSHTVVDSLGIPEVAY